MDFALSEEHQMLKDLVARFVREQLLPLEPISRPALVSNLRTSRILIY
jgi:hypothetical protein